MLRKKELERAVRVIRILINSPDPIKRQKIEWHLQYELRAQVPTRTLQRTLRMLRRKRIAVSFGRGRGTTHGAAPVFMERIERIRKECRKERFHWARYSPRLQPYPVLMPLEEALVRDYLFERIPLDPREYRRAQDFRRSEPERLNRPDRPDRPDRPPRAASRRARVRRSGASPATRGLNAAVTHPPPEGQLTRKLEESAFFRPEDPLFWLWRE